MSKQWEYRVVTLAAGWQSPGPGTNVRASDEWLQEALNEYGAEGWELAAMCEVAAPDRPMTRCTFKREKRQEMQWQTASHATVGTAYWSDTIRLATDNAACTIGVGGVEVQGEADEERLMGQIGAYLRGLRLTVDEADGDGVSFKALRVPQ
jgi:hypothetical protein